MGQRKSGGSAAPPRPPSAPHCSRCCGATAIRAPRQRGTPGADPGNSGGHPPGTRVADRMAFPTRLAHPGFSRGTVCTTSRWTSRNTSTPAPSRRCVPWSGGRCSSRGRPRWSTASSISSRSGRSGEPSSSWAGWPIGIRAWCAGSQPRDTRWPPTDGTIGGFPPSRPPASGIRSGGRGPSYRTCHRAPWRGSGPRASPSFRDSSGPWISWWRRVMPTTRASFRCGSTPGTATPVPWIPTGSGGRRDPCWRCRPPRCGGWAPTYPRAGGAYFRVFPLGLIGSALDAAERRGAPGTFYIHPWEFDDEIPRLGEGPLTGLRMRMGTGRSWSRVERLLDRFTFRTMGETLQEFTSRASAA
jgi:hypothetical protein